MGASLGPFGQRKWSPMRWVRVMHRVVQGGVMSSIPRAFGPDL